MANDEINYETFWNEGEDNFWEEHPEQCRDISERAARLATSKSKMAKVARACMSIARREDKFVPACVGRACEINSIAIGDFMEVLYAPHITTIQVDASDRDRLRFFGYPLSSALKRVLNVAEKAGK